MREQTYEALKQIALDTGGDIGILVDYFEDNTDWNKSDKEHIHFLRLCLYYLHCPDKLTESEYQRAAEIYKHLDKRSQITIS